MVQTRVSFLDELARAKPTTTPAVWERIHAWASARREPAIAFQREPAEIAGDGTACNAAP
jgi:hypothetical protein